MRRAILITLAATGWPRAAANEPARPSPAAPATSSDDLAAQLARPWFAAPPSHPCPGIGGPGSMPGARRWRHARPASGRVLYRSARRGCAPNDAVVDKPSKLTFLGSCRTEGAYGHTPGIATRAAG
jgi:hypothetical protein